MKGKNWRVESEQLNPFFPDSVGKSVPTNCYWWELRLGVRWWSDLDSQYYGWNLPFFNIKIKVDSADYVIPMSDGLTSYVDPNGGISTRVISSGELVLDSGSDSYVERPILIEDGLSFVGDIPDSFNYVQFGILADNKEYGMQHTFTWVGVNPDLTGSKGQAVYAPNKVISSLVIRRGYYY